MDRNVTLICTAADKALAEALAANFPGGSGTFSVKLTTVPGGTIPTHWAGSGMVPEEMATAFDQSVSPMYKVFPLEGTTFDQQLNDCEPRLYRVVEEL